MSSTQTVTLSSTTEPASSVSVQTSGSALNAVSSDGQLNYKRIHHIPWPETKEAQRRWQLEQMAGAFRLFAKLGYADGCSGHISLRGTSSR